MTIEELIHDMLVYFMPTLVLIVVVTSGWAIAESNRMKQRGWRREDETWDDEE